MRIRGLICIAVGLMLTAAAARNLEVVAGKYYGTPQLQPRSSTPICVDCNWGVD